MIIKTTSEKINCTFIHFNYDENNLEINLIVDENEKSKIIVKDFFEKNEFVKFKKLNEKYHKGIEKIEKYNLLKKSLNDLIWAIQ